ncbi:death-on-curing protein [Erysipelothrix inopinata]|uniref:Death-on-curing protein n=1 Tax=Erysipelothrix inopinata TaxID=225084 RepID=A0A7G9RWJ3_9FIRM|nr:death-on-curing protein [Erysipelothrix inopinata]QNN59968.1 death-on-curing protein [Erysipelothrix inopinata]
MGEIQENKVIIFTDDTLNVEVNVSPEEDTVWLSLNDISELFDKNKSTISRHINNIFNEGELDKSSTVAKNATVQKIQFG